MTKTLFRYPKFYICKYGAFYEGEVLERYCCESSYFYYAYDVILKKFLVHYNNYVPHLYFIAQHIDTKKSFTVSVEQLGIYYRKIRKKY